MEKPDEKGSLVFLDININVSSCKKLIASGTRNQPIRELSWISVAVYQSNIKRILSMGLLTAFLEALAHDKIFYKSVKENENVWLKNQYPE